ncbi:MAG: hypothetical protein HRT73_01095, partial [Flavobacteriales bacterium]|nr:hypothetical protein [Flavobacteriales bacterium]
MNNTIIILFLASLLFGCRESNKEKLTINKCDNYKLVDFVYPKDNFTKSKKLVYSLETNQNNQKETVKEFFRIENDSIYLKMTENNQGILTDSIIIKFEQNIPVIVKSFTREPEMNPNFILTSDIINGNKYCEFGKADETYSYKIPYENGEIYKEFKGITWHEKYVKETFNDIEYDCAIFKAEKTMKVSFNGTTEEIQGESISCRCKGIGELYGITKLENGLIIN